MPRKLLPDDRAKLTERIVALDAEGLAYATIAVRCGCSKSFVGSVVRDRKKQMEKKFENVMSMEKLTEVQALITKGHLRHVTEESTGDPEGDARWFKGLGWYYATEDEFLVGPYSSAEKAYDASTEYFEQLNRPKDG